MSVTKLKTVGNWQGSGWQSPGDQASVKVRGRVITGLLTGGALVDATVTHTPRKTEK